MEAMYVDGPVNPAEKSPQKKNEVAFGYSDGAVVPALKDSATQPATPIEYGYRDQEPAPFHEGKPAKGKAPKG
jgi:hypothetical protein